MSRAQALFRLQTIDSELDTLRARRREVEQALSDSPAVRRAQQEMLATQTRLDTARITARDLEQTEQTAEAHRAEVEERLYGGRVTNPKELQDLQHDLEMVKRQCAALEEQQLQALINAEAAEAQSVAAQHALQTTEMEAARTNGALAAEHVQLKARLGELEAQRAGVEAAVRAEDWERYRHLREIKKGRAVTPLTDGVCAVCGVTPSEASVHAARLDDELAECGNCGRILYIA